VIVMEYNVIVGSSASGISVESCTEPSAFGFCAGLVGGRVVPIVSNNRSGGNGAHGIFLRAGDDAVVQNNVLYSNGLTGLTLRGVADALVANNLVYRNGQEGLSIGSGFIDPGTSGDVADFAAPNAIVLNNTIYENTEWAVEIGSSLAASPGAAVVNNIIWRNGAGRLGIGVLNERGGVTSVREPSVCSYLSGFNDVLDDYGPDTPRNTYDLRSDPRFVDVAGPDGVMGGEVVEGQFIDRSADDDFHLRTDSPALDAGSTTVTRLGLTGSAAAGGAADQGQVDLGYHYDASAEQVLFYEPPFMPLFVRQSGDDTGDGLSPANAFASIRTAARRARAGVTVVVGPGVYRECDIHSPPDSGRAVFLADAAGERTGDAPGVVLVDAGTCYFDPIGQSYQAGQTGFNVASVCGVVIDGFHITGATDDGVQVQNQCDRGVVRNNVVFANAKRGINVVNSDDVRVANNLAFGNGGGIQIGSGSRAASECTDGGSRRAILEYNTAYNSTFNGILVGAGMCPSTDAVVRYNVTGENGKVTRAAGLEVGSDETRTQNLVGYVSRYNLVADRIATGVPRMLGDLVIDLAVEPLYLDPTTIGLSGDWRNDVHFRLAQDATGQTLQSRAVDYSDLTALKAGMSTRSTRRDGIGDAGAVDRGYHYPTGGQARAGDCDGDGVVTINEIILAVNIALGNAPLSACSAADVDGDGMVSIADLIQAVNAVLGG
jgi:parallel beta-helix repeat protein